MYVYYFTVDGVRLADPSNPQVKIGYVTTTTTSLVTVPGDGPAFYDVRDVPHGEIRTLLYTSQSNGVLWIACGKEDAAMKDAAALHQALGKAGIEHTFLETEGAHHWRVWRRYLRDLSPLLFN
jgi:enterochelin esterase-like enzyme